MELQDSKLTVQKSLFPAGYEKHNSLQDQKSRVSACERKAILDLPANVEIDMPLSGMEGNDFTAETILPLKTAIPGELVFWNLYASFFLILKKCVSRAGYWKINLHPNELVPFSFGMKIRKIGILS